MSGWDVQRMSWRQGRFVTSSDPALNERETNSITVLAFIQKMNSVEGLLLLVGNGASVLHDKEVSRAGRLTHRFCLMSPLRVFTCGRFAREEHIINAAFA